MSMRTVWLCRVLSEAFVITVMIKASKPDCQQKLKNITMTLDNGNESYVKIGFSVFMTFVIKRQGYHYIIILVSQIIFFFS